MKLFGRKYDALSLEMEAVVPRRDAMLVNLCKAAFLGTDWMASPIRMSQT